MNDCTKTHTVCCCILPLNLAICEGNPTNPANGAFSCSSKSLFGAECIATCDDRFEGAPSSTCGSDGTWGTISGKCEPVGRCKAPRTAADMMCAGCKPFRCDTPHTAVLLPAAIALPFRTSLTKASQFHDTHACNCLAMQAPPQRLLVLAARPFLVEASAVTQAAKALKCVKEHVLRDSLGSPSQHAAAVETGLL
jgi:hypothetical protein